LAWLRRPLWFQHELESPVEFDEALEPLRAFPFGPQAIQVDLMQVFSRDTDGCIEGCEIFPMIEMRQAIPEAVKSRQNTELHVPTLEHMSFANTVSSDGEWSSWKVDRVDCVGLDKDPGPAVRREPDRLERDSDLLKRFVRVHVRVHEKFASFDMWICGAYTAAALPPVRRPMTTIAS
jgi:hypothetical protein